MAQPEHAEVARGEYLFRAAGCASCHTDVDNEGPYLAGGRAIKTPFGIFYTPNITPHPAYGIGQWNDDEFVRALTEGVAPDGRYYYPVFPYTAYTRLHKDDVLAIKAYLFTQPAVARPNRSHELSWYLQNRYVNWIWNQMYFSPGEFRSRPDRTAAWNRGAYLVLAAAHCAECHTPRNRLGALNTQMLYAGTRNGPEGEVIPNITPDKKTGIGRWSKDDLSYYLETGGKPDGDYAGSLMAEVIDNGLRFLSKQDLQAIAHYILSLPPVEHAVRRKKKRGEFD